MKQSRTLNAMLDAKAAYESAARALVAATAAAFPIGTEVIVTLGRARIRGRVESVSDCWWYRPCDVSIVNVKTGKCRTFDPTFAELDLTVITPAPALRGDREAGCSTKAVCPTE